MAKIVRLADGSLAALATEFRIHKAAEKAAAALAAPLQEKLVEQLKLRSTTDTTVKSLRIRRHARKRRNFVVADVKARLERRLARQVIREEIDLGQWDALCKSGDITALDVKELVEEIPTGEWVTVDDAP